MVDTMRNNYIKILIFIIFIVFSLEGCAKMWNFEREFKKGSEGLDGGLLYVYDDRVYFQVDKREKIQYQSVYDKDGNTIDQVVTEEWMKDGSERLNRVYTELYRGYNDFDTELILRKQAQNSSLSISDDKKNIYVSTDFLDFKFADVLPKEDPNYDKKIHFYHLYKSSNGGDSFEELRWPLHTSLKIILFDATGNYGYALGGERTLWRTGDGAKTWQRITIPKSFNPPRIIDPDNVPKVSRDWDAFYLDPKTKTLYLSCFVHDPIHSGKGQSVIYTVPWDDKLIDLNQLKPVVSINNRFVTDIKPDQHNQFYLMSETYSFENYYTLPNEKSAQFIYLDNNKVVNEHEFGKGYSLGAMFLGEDNLIYIIGMKSTGIASYDDIAFISHDNGQSWKEELEGSWGQGSYFDPKTNKAWLYKQGKLYSRIIK